MSLPRASVFASLLVVGPLLWAGCSSGAAPTASSAAPGTSAAPGASGTPAPTEELKKGLLGGLKLEEIKTEVELRKDKKKAAFSIELPEGMKDFSDPQFQGRKEFRTRKLVLEDKTTHDGYTFEVLGADPKMVTTGLEGVLAELTKGDDFAKNKGKILDKGTNSEGWYFSATFEEKKKKGFVSMTLVTKGDVSLLCRGNYEGADGAEVAKPDEIAATLVKVCSTLKISDG